jgi:hypothetical protein
MICPKFGKNSRGIEKCMARDGKCQEMHSDRTCKIKPAKREVERCPSLPNDNGFCGGTQLGCPTQQCGIDEDISPYAVLCREMQKRAKQGRGAQ